MFIRTAPHRGTCWWCSRPKIFRQNWTWTNSFESQERCAARFTAQNPKSSTRRKTTSFRNRAEGDAAHKLRCEGTSRAMTGVRTSGWSHTLDLHVTNRVEKQQSQQISVAAVWTLYYTQLDAWRTNVLEKNSMANSKVEAAQGIYLRPSTSTHTTWQKARNGYFECS